ncbi:MAG: hypothetical protein ACYTG5_11350 [Planctomycetota bacterium]|jgi:hypothetical protein
MGRFPWLSIFLLAACSTGGPPIAFEAAPSTASIQDQLRREFGAELRDSPRSPSEVRGLADYDCLVFMSRRRESPISGMDAQTLQALREYVQAGGNLLLLGYAARMVHEMGVEPQAPDRVDVYRWGADERTLLGVYRYGFRAQGDESGMTRALRAEPDHEDAFLVGGGEVVNAQTCYWEGTPPEKGDVLGLLARERDGVFRDFPAVVLTRWREGEGTVLAYGNLPEPWRPEEGVAENARQFLRNALDQLDSRTGSLAVCTVPGEFTKASSSSVSSRLPTLEDRAFPGRVAVPHWGWQVASNYLHGSRLPMTPREILDAVIRPSYTSGASLLDLRVADDRSGFPFRWDPADPLSRPASWFGAGIWDTWAAHQVRLLAKEAHQRGMTMQLLLDPLPVRGGSSRELLASSKWLARELADPRRWGEASVDGFGFRTWFEDPSGQTSAVLQSYDPAAYYYNLDPRRNSVGGSLGVRDGEKGRPLGLNAAGLSETWRGSTGLYPPRSFPAALLDARVRRPPESVWGEARALGGGSYGDWILTQVNDFARANAAVGGALWWQAYNLATLDEATSSYLLGLSMDPMKAAFAGRLLSTGRGGYREILAAREERVQSGFGAESPLSAETPILQNNHFRLHGSGGPLWFDASGTAQFRLDAPGTLEVSTEFMTTRVRDINPTAPLGQPDIVDFIGGRPRAEGDYGYKVEIRGVDRGRSSFPANLARESIPDWPREVEVQFQAVPGRYRMELGVRSRGQAGMLELRLDGQLLRLIPVEAGQELQDLAFPLELGEGGSRRISLELIDGPMLGMRHCRLAWEASTAGETRVVDAAGHRAELLELNSSNYFSERLQLITIADLPGFLLQSKYENCARNVRVLREFNLEGYEGIRKTSLGDNIRGMKLPFVLAASDPALPNLAVVPLELPRFSEFFVSDEGRLVLESHPRENQRLRLGFLFLRDHGEEDLQSLIEVFRQLAEPGEVRVEAGAGAQIESNLPFTWPRVLRVQNPDLLPFMVREGGFWLHRGAQLAADGGHWLRIYQIPGHPVQVFPVGSPRLQAWPGAGSLHSMAISEADGGSLEIEVFAVGPLLAAPSLILREPFDRATVDGQPWSYLDGQRVFLPARPGRYRLELLRLNRDGGPSLRRTRALVHGCRYDEGDKTLRIETEARPEDRADQEYFAWISGGRPTGIEGASLVDDRDLTYPQQEVRNAVEAQGFVIRFKPGTITLSY